MICKLCQKAFCSDAILTLANMPSGAQHFLTEEELQTDTKQDLELYRCPHCGMIQLACEPVPYYRDCIRACGVSTEMAKEKTAYYHEIFGKYGLFGKDVVEIGCGGGEFLKLIQDAGANAYGMEHKKELIQAACDAGYEVRSGYPGDKDAPAEWRERFDGFTCTQFLEHASEPADFLAGIAKLLKSDAIGIVEVPNFDMIQKELLFTEFVADHLLYFTEDTLRKMLTINGFEVLDCNPHWHNYVLTAVVKKRKDANLSGFQKEKDQLVSDLQQFVKDVKESGQKLAIWGASHQALAIIGMSEIEDSIEYIVDSAEFKQGLYTPGTHLLVVPPMTLKERPVDVVLVMAASYNKEVVSIIRRNYPKVEDYVLDGTKLIQGGVLL